MSASTPARAASTLPTSDIGTIPAIDDVPLRNQALPPPPVVVHPYATISVKAHVPVTLEMKNSNYTKWASFKSMCGKFGLKPHIDNSSPPRPNNPQRDLANCCAKTWIFGSVDDSVLDLAMQGDDQSAHDL